MTAKMFAGSALSISFFVQEEGTNTFWKYEVAVFPPKRLIESALRSIANACRAHWRTMGLPDDMARAVEASEPRKSQEKTHRIIPWSVLMYGSPVIRMVGQDYARQGATDEEFEFERFPL